MVSNELRKSESQGIIEIIDPSDWISPVVVSWKKNGTFRLCVDFREAIKSIIPDRFPLPKSDEMFS